MSGLIDIGFIDIGYIAVGSSPFIAETPEDDIFKLYQSYIVACKLTNTVKITWLLYSGNLFLLRSF